MTAKRIVDSDIDPEQQAAKTQFKAVIFEYVKSEGSISENSDETAGNQIHDEFRRGLDQVMMYMPHSMPLTDRMNAIHAWLSEATREYKISMDLLPKIMEDIRKYIIE